MHKVCECVITITTLQRDYYYLCKMEFKYADNGLGNTLFDLTWSMRRVQILRREMVANASLEFAYNFSHRRIRHREET